MENNFSDLENECINKLRNFCKVFRYTQNQFIKCEYEDYADLIGVEEITAIECLLDLYNKEKEKNKELKERLENRRAIDKELEIENKTLLERHKNTMDLIGANYIHKDKVKEKIKEFNVPIMPRTIERGCGAKDGIIYILQELLEEGE